MLADVADVADEVGGGVGGDVGGLDELVAGGVEGDGWTVPASMDTGGSCPDRWEFVDGFDTP